MIKGLVTVVVPIYKTEKYLDRCITSIVNQTYSDLEILLIDDGSPDSCPEMCDNWAGRDNRIRVIHKQNEGLGMARNSGIENAKGEYICFFDSDDYVALDAIEKAYQLAVLKEVDVVVFGMISVNKDGAIVACSIPVDNIMYYRDEDVHSIFLPDLIDGGHKKAQVKNLCMSACACLLSMNMITKCNWRFVSERDVISEDSYSLMMLYKSVTSVAVLKEALYFYCENDNSLTRVYRQDRYGHIQRYYKLCNALLEEMGCQKQVHKSVSGVFLSFSIAAMKQIAAADLSEGEKVEMLAQIVNDQTMQYALKDVMDRDYGLPRRILFWAMRHKYYRLCYHLLVAQNAVRR